MALRKTYSTIIGLLFCVIASAQVSQETLTGKAANLSNALEKQTQQAFLKMKAAAALDSVHIELVSGYRSFEQQRSIWNRKYKKYKIQGLEPQAIFDSIVTYSTLPGTSRHHWGTDIDIIDGNMDVKGDVLLTVNYEEDGPYYKLKQWMENYASTYGFELVYTNDKDRPGFLYEPWHYTFIDVSKSYYHQYLEDIDLPTFLRSQSILGMDQISDVRLLQYLKEHVQGINPTLKAQ